MIVEELKVENFRNFQRSELHFSSPTVFLEGANGQGKTSLLEAIFYLANLRSFRTSKLNEMKKIGSSSFRLSLLFQRSPGWKSSLEVEVGQVRSLLADRIPVMRASDFTGKIKTVAFLPDDPLIVSGPSPLRRRFFDMFISMLDRSYFTALQEYSQALRSRNFLLKSRKFDSDILRSYTSVLASTGAQIVRTRLKFTALMADLMKKLFEDLYPALAKFDIRMRYVRETENPTDYFNKAERESSRDCSRGFTTFGPHLDDFDFVFDDKPMRSFGSRGQCRMTSLVLKLAELDAVRQLQGELQDTIVLVDDATADLDAKARESFLNKIRSAGQTFFAFTEIPPEYWSGSCEKFRIQDGKIAEES